MFDLLIADYFGYFASLFTLSNKDQVDSVIAKGKESLITEKSNKEDSYLFEEFSTSRRFSSRGCLGEY